METWDIWSTDGASQGLSFALAKIDAAGAVWLHAPPQSIRVEVSREDGSRRAFGDNLTREGERLPMCLLTVSGDTITREERWPTAADLGTPVILPGGEAGILTAWWNADDKGEWRWSVEFYNRVG